MVASAVLAGAVSEELARESGFGLQVPQRLPPADIRAGKSRVKTARALLPLPDMLGAGAEPGGCIPDGKLLLMMG